MMKENELPSYAQLLDFYKRYADDSHVLTRKKNIPIETSMEAREYFEDWGKAVDARETAIDLAVKNVEYRSVFLFAEQIYDYIMNGKTPENVKPKEMVAPSED